MTGHQRRYEQLAWPDIQTLANGDGSTLIWPFGACEQHGPHLPLVTDALFAERITKAVVADLNPQLPIWSLPTQVIGFSPEHRSFPGTLSLSSDLLIAVVVQLGEQLAAMGWRRLVLFNAHGGQIALLQVAASLMSPSMNLNRRRCSDGNCCSTVSTLWAYPVEKLSKPTTYWFNPSKVSTKCDPIKPAAPVTNHFRGRRLRLR